jgi:hypothetical protein
MMVFMGCSFNGWGEAIIFFLSAGLLRRSRCTLAIGQKTNQTRGKYELVSRQGLNGDLNLL